MPNFLKLVTLTSFVALSGTAMAQDAETPKPQAETATAEVTTVETTTTETTTAETVTEAVTDAATTDTAATAAETTEAATDETPEGLSMGEEVVEENAVGSTYVLERIGDWDLRCVRVPEGEKEPCQLFQLMKDENGAAIAEINFVTLAKGSQAVAGATIVAPLETLLTKQLTLAVDGGAKKRYPFRFCNQVGCYSQIGFSNADVASFKRGASASLTIVPAFAPTETITVKLSLTGFTKAYETLKKLNDK